MDGSYRNSVLIVDDGVSNIAELTHILDSEYDILAANNGKNAISVAIEHMPDVILLDILMPDMNGHDVLYRLKKDERTRSIPVLFVTGLNKAEDEEEGLALGAADYISKPFNPAIVRLRIRNQIKVREAERFMKFMLDSSPLAVTMMNDKGEALDCNQEAIYMFGVADKEEYKEKFFLGLTPERQPNGELSHDLGLMHLNLAIEKGYHQFEWVHQKVTGEPIPCEITLVHAKLGNRSMLVSHMHDLRVIKAHLEEKYSRPF